MVNNDEFDDPTDRRRALLQQMPGEDQTNPLGMTPGTMPPVTGPTLGASDPTNKVTAPPYIPDPGRTPSGSGLTDTSIGNGLTNPNTKADAAVAAPAGASAAPKTLEEAMAYANKTAYGYDKHTDANYWQALYAKDPEYALKRMLGMGAGKQDAAKFGEWAGGDPNAEVFGAGGGAGQTGGQAGGQSKDPFGLGIQGLDMSSVLAELQALIGGQKSPSSRSAILSQMKG